MANSGDVGGDQGAGRCSLPWKDIYMCVFRHGLAHMFSSRKKRVFRCSILCAAQKSRRERCCWGGVVMSGAVLLAIYLAKY